MPLTRVRAVVREPVLGLLRGVEDALVRHLGVDEVGADEGRNEREPRGQASSGAHEAPRSERR